MSDFRAWLIGRGAPGARGQFVNFPEQELDGGDVLIKVSYSAVNRRDALAELGEVPVVRRFPCIGGMDLAGVVVRSAAPRFVPGSRVFATGYGLGAAHHGGFAEYALLPGGWVQDVPDGISLRDCMALGSAGLAAAMALTRLEDNGLRPEMGPVLVSGASGGVGSLAVAMLAARGYEVVAASRREALAEWLLELGARRAICYGDPCLQTAEPLGKGIWAGAVDNLGGAILGAILRTLKPGGSVASVGDVSGAQVGGTALPFVARGVGVLGVEATQAGFALRERIWARLAADLRPQHLSVLTKVVAFEELPEMFGGLLGGHMRGRTVVRIAQDGCEKESS